MMPYLYAGMENKLSHCDSSCQNSDSILQIIFRFLVFSFDTLGFMAVRARTVLLKVYKKNENIFISNPVCLQHVNQSIHCCVLMCSCFVAAALTMSCEEVPTGQTSHPTAASSWVT